MKTQFSKLALAASIVLAMAFTFGCSSDKDDDNSGGGSGTGNGGGDKYTSGSGCTISGYKTVEIGTQTWMAQNLNCDVSGSECYENNCAKYSRLYDWATAMALPSSCNNDFCTSQIDAKHKGICPEGWHIPNNEDWNVLIKFVYPNCSDKDDKDCYGTGGAKLKATSGWKYNGTDEYGFAALPSHYVTTITVYNVDWWSASEDGRHGGGGYCRSISDLGSGYPYDGLVSFGYPGKNSLRSVRCLKDD